MYVNGTSIGSSSYTSGIVQGGGTLVIGQEQDDINAGSFDFTQAYRGSKILLKLS